MMNTREAQIKTAAEDAIEKYPKHRVLSFTFDDETFWIKRKMGNGRRAAVKYSAEREFYYEIARMTIAAKSTPELVVPIEVLTPTYMVTKDGGPTLKLILDSDISEDEKEKILEGAGAALATLHHADIVHGRPALRDICFRDGKYTFLDWENRLYLKKLNRQKAIDLLLLLQGLCRENYEKEKCRLKALDKGYTTAGGKDIRREAIRFLNNTSFLGKLTRKLQPFHMKDVDAVRKAAEYLLEESPET
jgi:tRNA A-37 threonylcarbamoyl transferase component Bud32